MRDDAGGDPMTGLKWSRKTTEKISAELGSIGIRASANTVGRLMRQLGYSLRTSQKTIESGFKPKPGHRRRRNQQFLKIKADRAKFRRADLPIISIDAKKKELVGNFRNPGKTWGIKPKQVYDHDFRSDATGMAVPYGIYDVRRNRGLVVLGSSRETPAFAVDAVAEWWKLEGKIAYKTADRILIIGDCGGGNSARSRVWKRDLQEKVCNRFGLTITVSHYPPGASKWNPIEHRLFSEISKNWAGEPLLTYETALKYLRTTRTKKGLRVRAVLNTKRYEKGEKVSHREMKNIRCIPHQILPQWNYTIKPQI